MRGGVEYNPPISETEMRQMDNLPFERVKSLLAGRMVRLTPMQALRKELVLPSFWKRVAKGSFLLFAAIFGGCIYMGVLEDQSRRNRETASSHGLEA